MSSGSKRSKSKPIIPPEVQAKLNESQAQASQALGQSFVAGKDLVAGPNQNITAAQDTALASIPQQQQIAQQAVQGFGALAGFGSGDDPVLQRRLDQISRLGNRNLQESLLPSIRRGAVQAGHAGSSRQGIAEGIAARGTQESIMDAQTDLLGQSQAQRLSALQSLQGAAQGASQAALLPSQVQGAVGAQQRDIDQQMLQDPLLRQQAELQRVGGLGNITSQLSAPQIGQTGTSSGRMGFFDALAKTGQAIGGITGLFGK